MDEKQVDQLVQGYRSGSVTRREFLRRATFILGGSAAATALLLAANGAPFAEVVKAAGQVEQAATMAATQPPIDIDTQTVSFKGGSQDATGYFAKPKGDGPFPGVVVIQEWWGVDDHIKSVVERFARQGYAALAPDLYRGVVAKEPTDAQRLIMKVQQDQALADIQGAVNYLVDQTYVAPKEAGVIGFCFGGRLAMLMAYKGDNVGAVATFYGAGLTPSDADLEAVDVPIIGFYGANDGSTPADKVNEWFSKLAQFGKIGEKHIYEGAGHAFFNDSRPSSYNQAASEDAWPRVLDWFGKYLTASAATPPAEPTMAATMASTPSP